MAGNAIGVDPASASSSAWPVMFAGSEVTSLGIRYRASHPAISDDAWERIVFTAARILGRCMNPAGPDGSRTGLALGKVQSGKTLSYTSLLAMAFDNGYRLAVVLAGTKTPLFEQTYGRLCNDLGTSRGTIVAFKNPAPGDTDVIRNVLQSGGRALMVVMKHRKRITDARDILSSMEINGFPALVIDDEGDEASLNTQFRRNARSPVYSSVLSLRQNLRRHTFLAYTATPQANLLISGLDALSPDFIGLVDPGDGYCGGSIFFGTNRDRYVRVIPVADVDPEGGARITDSLRSAIATFVVGAAIRQLRQPDGRHSMLVHTSQFRVGHEAMQLALRSLLENWRTTATLPEEDPARIDLLQVFEGAYRDLATTMASPPSWEVVRHQLLTELIPIEVWMVNSLPFGRDPVSTPFRLRNNILVGGNMLGRGVTIDGLSVTYITRRAQKETNADTMEQRARWYGYKREYLDLCRVFLTEQLRGDYTDLLDHEDDLWESFERNERQHLTVRDWVRMLRLSEVSGLHPTRANVASYRRFQLSDWEVQRRVVVDPLLAPRNVQVVRGFFDEHGATPRMYGNAAYRTIADCPTDVVVRGLLGTVYAEVPGWDSDYVSEYLLRLFIAGSLPTVDVVMMTKEDGLPRDRNYRENGQIEPQQGPSTNYPGDQHIHNGRVQLQVHLIRPIGNGSDAQLVTTAFALYIPPKNPLYNLSFVVRTEDT